MPTVRSPRDSTHRQVTERYRGAVARRGEVIDLGVGRSRLPPLPLADLDMHVIAQLEGRTNLWILYPEWPLAWLIRGHRRTLLTGLPGAGKSVALRAAAAFYARRDDWPLPLVVPLSRFRDRRRSMGHLDALIDVALEQEPATDRMLLTDIAGEALANGRAVLFLDGLDETRLQRRAVVRDLHEALAAVPAGVEVLLTTRDVGYADAQVLGFDELTLVPPGSPETTIAVVLETIAERTRVPQPERAGWVARRTAWVQEQLRIHEDLRNTPLSIVLLIMVSAEDEPDRLPRGRAAVLSRIVRDIIRHWELARRGAQEPIALGPLQDNEASDALWDAFSAIGHHIVQATAPTAATAEVEAGHLFVKRWGLAPARATTAARAAVDFWDEQGVFVKSGASEALTPPHPIAGRAGRRRVRRELPR